MRELIGSTSFDFLGKRRFFYLLSLLLVASSVYLWCARGEEKYGVDFKGGHEFLVKVEGGRDSESLAKFLKERGLNDPLVQSFEEGSNEYSVRVGGENDPKQVREQLAAALSADKGEILSSDFVGPVVGRELKRKALIAVVLSLLGILVYIAWRFEFAFALGAVVALFHDVIVATGVYLLAGHDLNMGVLAAALTIVGYSVNDTIVIFDRVREEIFKRKDYDLESLMNDCVNVTLSRTLITSLLTLFAAVALLVFGGGAIRDLSVYLVAGIIAGSYSTIFIASPIVLSWDTFSRRREERRAARVAQQAAR